MSPSVNRTTRIKNPALFICDIQERFRPIIHEYPKLITTTIKLLRASQPLNLPIYVTTQNRARLGEIVSEITPFLDTAKSQSRLRADVDKTLFSMITPEFKALLPEPTIAPASADGGALDAIIVGIEAHICVTQTALDLLSLGHRVYIAADGVSSSSPEERAVAIARMRDAGAIITTSESLMFEILEDTKVPAFREISKLVKETGMETKEALQALCPVSKI